MRELMGWCFGLLWLAAVGAIAAPAAAGQTSLRFEDVVLEAGQPTVALELRRFEVFGPEARTVVHSEAGAELRTPPALELYRGGIAGEPESLAVLAVTQDGATRGWISRRQRWFDARAPDRAGPLRVLERTPSAGAGGGACAAAGLGALSIGGELFEGLDETREGGSTGGPYAVDLAIDTDWELFDRFGSVEATSGYLAMLVAAISAIYERDVATHLQITHLDIWTTPADPWTVEDDLFEALYEFGDYWHANHATTERTLAHFVSGKAGLGGGIAYGGVLCSPDIFINGHWAGGYGVSGSMGHLGDFRDTFIMSHELGHNFDSRHTHCYNDMPRLGDPEVDQCRSGETTGGGHVCYAGATSLPTDGGSIMSYCHLQPGGYGNINLWLGREGFYGVESERVPAKMLAHVESVAACLPAPPALFDDDFESGDTAAWSVTVP